MKKAVILDLDNCLAAASAVGQELFKPAFDAIRKANCGKLCEDRLRQAFEDVWRHPLDWVARHYKFSDEMLAAAWSVFTRLEVGRAMHGYGDLAVLAELTVQRFLVTSGFRRLQESKIRALDIRHHFAAIFIDAIDEPGRIGKLGLFQVGHRGNEWVKVGHFSIRSEAASRSGPSAAGIPHRATHRLDVA
jgi:hypothetical protein